MYWLDLLQLRHSWVEWVFASSVAPTKKGPAKEGEEEAVAEKKSCNGSDAPYQSGERRTKKKEKRSKMPPLLAFSFFTLGSLRWEFRRRTPPRNAPLFYRAEGGMKRGEFRPTLSLLCSCECVKATREKREKMDHTLVPSFCQAVHIRPIVRWARCSMLEGLKGRRYECECTFWVWGVKKPRISILCANFDWLLAWYAKRICTT